jgi:hypothetical protein
MGTALRVAKDVGIDKTAVWAGVSPQGKTALIQQMQEHGDIVAMVSTLCILLIAGWRRNQRLPRTSSSNARHRSKFWHRRSNGSSRHSPHAS